MKKIPLTQGKFAIVDDDDFEMVNKYKWSVDCWERAGLCYAISGVPTTKKREYKNMRMHRLIMNPTKGYVVDHINGDGLDNRRSNLRICTTRDNVRNKRRVSKRSSTGYVGVCKRITKNGLVRYQAHIHFNDKFTHLGMYLTAEEAYAVYRKKAKEIFGEFFPEKMIE